MKTDRKNLVMMYVENNFRFGFYVNRDSWSNGKYAKVVAIDGVEEGKPIDGVPPYYNRTYPVGHPNAGKIWPRTVHMEADWFDNGTYQTESSGTYGWTRVYPENTTR